jgi:phosphoglycerol transferase MdoB-like AlkP superfamily enzyme
LYFYILFFIGRVIFYVGLTAINCNPQFTKIIEATYQGLYLDTATICYASILPIIFISFYILSKNLKLFSLARTILYIFSFIWAIISIAEILIYREWRSKLSIQAVLHLSQPSEVIKTASTKEIAIFIIALCFALWISKILLNRFFNKPSPEISQKKSYTIGTLILLLTLSGIGLRGGLQPIPIQVSDACYSNNNMYNDIAINPLFSFLANVRNYINHEKTNPFNNVDLKAATNSVDSLLQLAHMQDGNLKTLWDTNFVKPNLVFIILEGVSAHCCKAFDGENYMPFLDSITKSGLAFTKCYPSGHLSDMGNASILSSYPASPSVSILMMPNKSATLPLLNQPLEEIGYSSKYYFGGQLTYGNIKQYLLEGNLDSIFDETNLDASNLKLQRLGINDIDMAQIFLDGNNKSKQPFLNCWFTISSHNPYDIPEPIKKITDFENPYVNTVMYTDKALKLFFDKAKFQSWYTNTLFVIVSDHSHISHRNKNIREAEYHRIPLLFYGDVLQKKWAGQKIDYTVSQLDIAYTILESLGLQNELPKYKFGKSLLNTKIHFAPYTYFNGAGLVYDSSVACYDLGNLARPSYVQNSNDTFLQLCKSISAINYEDYRKR